MTNKFIPYSELKSRVSIMDVAAELGYKLDIKQGRKFPVMVKTDGSGRKIDSIVICNPGNNDRMGFFREPERAVPLRQLHLPHPRTLRRGGDKPAGDFRQMDGGEQKRKAIQP